MPLAFVFADTTEAKVDNTVKVLEEAGRRYWAPRRYETYYREAITARDHSQAVPVVFTTLEQLTGYGAGAAAGVQAVWAKVHRSALGGDHRAPDGLEGRGRVRVRHLLRRRRCPQGSRRRSSPPRGRHRAGRCGAGPGLGLRLAPTRWSDPGSARRPVWEYVAAATPPKGATEPVGRWEQRLTV
ncbi:hypothetical protein [Streptomyces sp. DH37]|uniref:hypothetical protein n=1 Tax=Streptomyces sp. DH37 TaxID=3040122 RepID=UPI002441DCE3|nr:hypothetical protein [Streptomyces sp. DH37]MDG9703842.1 hypothetical protein [Streptomyces sp. DH37]